MNYVLPEDICTRIAGTAWVSCEAGFENELTRELRKNPKHQLYGVSATSVARRDGTDDVLFVLPGQDNPLVVVHLTYNEEWRPDWPSFAFYANWDDWLERCVIPDETP